MSELGLSDYKLGQVKTIHFCPPQAACALTTMEGEVSEGVAFWAVGVETSGLRWAFCSSQGFPGGATANCYGSSKDRRTQELAVAPGTTTLRKQEWLEGSWTMYGELGALAAQLPVAWVPPFPRHSTTGRVHGP